jgi:hypothetical protein
MEAPSFCTLMCPSAKTETYPSISNTRLTPGDSYAPTSCCDCTLHVPPPILELGQAQALTHLCGGQAPAHVLLVGKHEDGAAGAQEGQGAGVG